jgi:hypothetical protein
MENHRRTSGIPLVAAVVSDLQELGHKTGVAF